MPISTKMLTLFNLRKIALQCCVGFCCPTTWISHNYTYVFSLLRVSLVAQRVKHLPAMQETWVRSLGWEDPPEKAMATDSSTFAWKIPWTEEPGRLQSMGSQRVRHDWVASLSFPFSLLSLFPLLPSHSSRPSQGTRTGVFCYTAASH